MQGKLIMPKQDPVIQAEKIAAKARDRLKQKNQNQQTQTATILHLPVWNVDLRCLPNEILRSALFNAKNRHCKREYKKAANIAVIGDARIIYTGEELRQDDQAVWLQLIHLAKEQPIGQVIEFTAYSFRKALKWSNDGRSYERLRQSLIRMQATALNIYSKRLGKGVSLSMIPFFEWVDEATEEKLTRWRVRVAPELVQLFGDVHYTRLEWEQRLALPNGLASWLYGYFATHQIPYPIRLETIKEGAGLTVEQNKHLKEKVKKALDGLVKVGFLANWEIRGNLVTVTRV
jgi:TrfA protein